MLKLRDNHTRFACAAFVLALLFPSIAFADAGTPLMLFEFAHLFVLNLFIGIFEGLIIWSIFRTGILRTIGILILANYLSAWVGCLGLVPLVDKIGYRILADAPLYNAIKFIVIMGVAAFILSIILEWPFCLWTLRKKPNRITKSFIAALFVNIISYAFLVWLYLGNSTLTVYKNLSIDRNLTFPDVQKYWVYFVSSDDGDIYRIHPDGLSKSKVIDANLHSTHSMYVHGPLLVARTSNDKSGYDLWATDIPDSGQEQILLMKKFVSNSALVKARRSQDWIYIVTDFRDPNTSAWEAYNQEYFASPGLIVENKKASQEFTVGLETPFLSWMVRSPIILPGDFVIFQLGDQIVLLDINNRKIRLIALGRGPVVTMD